MFDKDALAERIKAANNDFITGEDSQEAPPQVPDSKSVQVAPEWQPIDIYQHHQRKQISNSKKEFPKGSRALVMALTERAINGANGLALHKKKAENDSESLKANGYKDRAELMKQQYMEERFLPSVEIVIDGTSPDELLNCKEALRAFDKMALGVGSMSGYTAAYIRQAYKGQLGQKRGGSDPTVAAEMRRIKQLVGDDQIRTAIGIATKLKKKIDDGEAMAEPEDYAVLGRIVAYAN